jgi:hypothetical protein
MRSRILLRFAFLVIVFGTTSTAGQQSIQGGRISGQVLDGVTGEPLNSHIWQTITFMTDRFGSRGPAKLKLGAPDRPDVPAWAGDFA